MNKKRILYINPVGQPDADNDIRAYLESARNETTEIEVVSLRKGPHHLEYHYYEALVGVEVKNGYDAAIIGCFYDPFLREAREICDRIVVTASAESSLHLAATMGDTFSIIVGRKKMDSIHAPHRFKLRLRREGGVFQNIGAWRAGFSCR